jgi:integrase
METHSFPLIDGTSALASSSQLEAEFAKDRWDARNIPGLPYAPHGTHYYVDFHWVPQKFREVVKDYARFKLAAGRAVQTLQRAVYCVGNFLTFLVEQHSTSLATLHELSAQDVERFIVILKAKAEAQKLKDTQQYLQHHILYLEEFLCYLERSQNPIRPHEPTARIVWPHHYPKRNHPKSGQVKYIPKMVLSQLDAHLQHLPPVYIPIIILLRASGWRISDILYLKRDTCLKRQDDKFSLVGDIQKTRTLGHTIPITAEIAAVVLAQIAWVKQHYTSEDNPQKWLFPASKTYHNATGPRFLNGQPLGARGVRTALDRLVEKYQIRDEKGEVFHFGPHAFRHTKAIELLNNGMSLVMVQQWMAHASPEMTLIYARILDETMRAQWEKAVQNGLVQFNDGKPEYISGKKLLPMAGPNTFDPERVREHRQNIKMALGSCLKTAKIICKFVELPCFHCPAYVLTPDDLPALEAYEQQILARIEIGKQAGNAHWTEVNQKNLDERVRPAIALLKEGQIVAKTDKHEREYTDEEWKQRQHNQQEETHE